jgi:cytochrome c oxidase assembly protein subunit 15
MQQKFRIFAWSVLIFQLAVIIWGAFVRASGSGAGCGEHWPLCNGQVIPQAQISATLIEFAHRVTSGLAVISTVVLAIWAWRAFPRGHAARTGALLALIAIFIESAIGAALVLLRLVASNESLSRGLWLAAHLVNTLFLLAALSVTAWEADRARERATDSPHARRDIGLTITGFVLAGVLGTFAALGDTLTVSTSLTEGLRADFSSLSNIFVRVRILHPLMAGALGIWLLAFVTRLITSKQTSAAARRLAGAIAVLVICQVSLGVANILLAAPVWLQLTHLLGADLLWIASVLLASELYLAASAGSPDVPVFRAAESALAID